MEISTFLTVMISIWTMLLSRNALLKKPKERVAEVTTKKNHQK